MPRFLLLPLLLLAALASADACQYCRLAATDPEAARMAAMMHSGGFPLDATINRFQSANPSAVLMGPPTAGSVATSAADLPATPRTAGTAVETSAKSVAASPITSRTAGTAVPTLKAAPKPVTWADAGLLGMLVIGGLFYWRTRREDAPVA